MAFSVPIWEVKATGDDTNNGGGFCTGGSISFPTDGAATSATGAAPVFSSASYNFVSGDIGHYIFIKSGTNWIPGWYKITGLSGNSAVLDAAVGSVVLYASGIVGQSIGINRTAGIATTASPTNGTWGVDYSQKSDGSSRITFTDMVIDGAVNTRFTSAANPVGKNFVGNIISVTSGTGFTVQRVAVNSTSGTTATCDKSLGTGGSTGGNSRMGGAFATPGIPAGLAISLNAIWIQSGSYTLNSGSNNVSGGLLSITVATRLEGYGTVRGDLGTAPVFTASGLSTVTLFTLSTVASHVVRNITLDGASLTAIKGLTTSGIHLQKILIKNCTNGAFNVTGNGTILINCRGTGCATASQVFGGIGSPLFYIGCVADNNSVPAFVTSTTAFYDRCLASLNSGASSDGFSLSSNDVAMNCVSYHNGRDGFRIQSALDTVRMINCIAEGNDGWGFNAGSNSALERTIITYCATFDNDAGSINFSNLPTMAENNIAGSVSFFVDAASGNFAPALNSPIRQAGWPGALLYGGTGYVDMGALQSQNVGGGMQARTIHIGIGLNS